MDDTYRIGELIEDSYGNPAIVTSVRDGRPDGIRQLAGSDRGRYTYAPLVIRRIEPGPRWEWARGVLAELDR